MIQGAVGPVAWTQPSLAAGPNRKGSPGGVRERVGRGPTTDRTPPCPRYQTAIR